MTAETRRTNTPELRIYLMKSQAYASNQVVVRVREAVMVRASLEQVGGERGRGRDTQRAKSVTSTI